MSPLAALAFPVIDPVAIEIGPIAIRWYALAYVAGIVLGWWLALRLVGRPERFPPRGAPSKRDLDDLVVFAAIGIVVGGRLGYVLFYDLARFIENPLEIPQVWRGGMAFHGGAIGLVLATLVFARMRKLSFLTLMDVVAAVAPIGIFFGRIANFVNGELWGRVTDVSWAVVFPRGGDLPRHPSQIYQAMLEGALLFALTMLIVYRFNGLRRPGLVSGWFLIGYGIARTIGEVWREPDPQLGFLWAGLTMGQLLSLPMIALGFVVVAHARRRHAATT